MELNEIKKMVGTEINKDGPWMFTAENLNDFIIIAVGFLSNRAYSRLNYGDMKSREFYSGNRSAIEYIKNISKEN